MLADVCVLCELPLPKRPIVEEEKAFCCTGCQVVYQILSSKEITENFQTNSLFRHASEAGIISNPSLNEEISQKTIDAETKRLHLEITQMWCPSCAEAIRLILMRQKGIKYCVGDYATDLAVIDYAPRYLGKERISKLIERLG